MGRCRDLLPRSCLGTIGDRVRRGRRTAQSMSDPQKSTTVFILGAPRSGTTLLNSLLNKSSRVALLKEFHLFGFPAFAFRLKPLTALLDRLDLYNQMVDFNGVDHPRGAKRFSRAEALECVYQTFGAANQADIVGEKSPFFLWRYESLRRAFPGARVVMILRPVAETIASERRLRLKLPHLAIPENPTTLLWAQERLFRILRRHENDEGMLAVSYEDLVEHTEESMQRICRFLGVEYDPDMVHLKSGPSGSKPKDHQTYGRILPAVVERSQYGDDPVEPKYRAKIERYRARWARRYPEWFGRLEGGEGKAIPVSTWEFLKDRAQVEAGLFKRRLMECGFSLAPLFLLRWYRGRRPLGAADYHRGRNRDTAGRQD